MNNDEQRDQWLKYLNLMWWNSALPRLPFPPPLPPFPFNPFSFLSGLSLSSPSFSCSEIGPLKCSQGVYRSNASSSSRVWGGAQVKIKFGALKSDLW